MTYLTDQVAINQAYKNGSWFNTFMDATGLSGFDKGKREASLQAKVLEWMKSSGIKVDNDFGRDEFTNEYTMTSYSGNVGSSGIKEQGNPNILEDERTIVEKYLKIESSDIATKFQSIEWEEIKRIIALSEQGFVRLNDRMNDIMAKHIAKLLKLTLMKYLSGFSGTYNTYTNGSTTPVAEKFSLQTQFLTDLPRNLTFAKLLETPRMLMEMGKIPESENNMQSFIALPDIIFDALITKTLETTPSQFHWVLGTQTNQPLSYYKNGIEFDLKNRVDAQSIKFECNLSTGISIRRLGKLESYQIWEQNIADTIGGAKTFKCPMWIGNEGFKFSMPTPNAVNELNMTMDSERTIKPTGRENIYFQERRVTASQSNRAFSINKYNALTRQCFVPLQLENACAFEIDAASILGITQAELETLIDTKYKPVYASTFYEAGHLDENHTFLKPIV